MAIVDCIGCRTPIDIEPRYCTKQCARKHQVGKKMDLSKRIDRFWANTIATTIRPGMDSPCVEWMKGRDKDGYGTHFRLLGEVRAHRIAWVIRSGPIPPGKFILHRCDNPPCVLHLFLGDADSNMKDRLHKGRYVPMRGDEHPSAKLTSAVVEQLRGRTLDRGDLTRIAKNLGVSHSALSMALRGLRWKGT